MQQLRTTANHPSKETTKEGGVRAESQWKTMPEVLAMRVSPLSSRTPVSTTIAIKEPKATVISY